MSVDIDIIQKSPAETVLPLSVVMGHVQGDNLLISESGDGWFIAFDPEHVGRGINVDWTEDATDKVSLRMLQPTCPDEVRAFYRMVERIASYWDCAIEVEGEPIGLQDFLATLDEAIETNEGVVCNVLPNVISEEGHTAQIMSALMTLSVDAEDIAGFVADPATYYAWLHERQSIDADYVEPRFFREEDGSIEGAYPIRCGMPSILPLKPAVPFGLRDAENDEPLKVEAFRADIINKEGTELLRSIPYDQFIESVREGSERFDAASILVTVQS